jgi:hypothetical protein
MVEILRLSADVDQSIDRTGSTKNLAAWRDDFSIVALGLRLGRLHQLNLRSLKSLPKPSGI